MKISVRGWSVVLVVAAILAALAGALRATAAGDGRDIRSGQLTERSLGNLIEAMGLQYKKEQQRYDFAFKAKHQGAEWELSMSAVLAQNGESIWVMAWLDQMPDRPSITDVPRHSLLRLLALNDTLGQGKFFAYISSNKRFVLQRVVPNQGMSTEVFNNILQDLGASVVQTYPYWSIEKWKGTGEGAAPASAAAANQEEAPRTTSAAPAAQSRRVPANTAVNDSNFRTAPAKR